MLSYFLNGDSVATFSGKIITMLVKLANSHNGCGHKMMLKYALQWIKSQLPQVFGENLDVASHKQVCFPCLIYVRIPLLQSNNQGFYGSGWVSYFGKNWKKSVYVSFFGVKMAKGPFFCVKMSYFVSSNLHNYLISKAFKW